MNKDVDAFADLLPSHVLVLSGDAVDWSREWGVQAIHFRQITQPGLLGLENVHRIIFGPYKQGYPLPVAFCVLDQRAKPVTDWAFLNNRPDRLRDGDTVTFAPGAIQFTMAFQTHGMRQSRPPTHELNPERKALPWWRR